LNWLPMPVIQSSKWNVTLADEPAEHGPLPRFAIHGRDRFGKRDVLGTRIDTVLRIGAFPDTARTEESFDALLSVHGARRMHVEEAYLRDDGGADEIVVGIYLRANFQTRAAGNAARQRIGFLLNLGSDSRTFAEIIGAIDRDPSFDPLERVKHELAVDGEIANRWKFGHGLEADGLLEIIDKRGASHLHLAIDNHGAGTADLLQTIGVVRNGSGLFAIASNRVFGDVAQANDDVHGGTPAKRELFPMGRLVWTGLALDF
jgi:hypothetical protein